MLPLDDETRWILGRHCFACASIARALRNMGHAIPDRIEVEQAEVIYWMLGLREAHGDGWRAVAEATLRAGAAAFDLRSVA